MYLEIIGQSLAFLSIYIHLVHKLESFMFEISIFIKHLYLRYFYDILITVEPRLFEVPGTAGILLNNR